MTIHEIYTRLKNACLYKMGMRFPYLRIRIWSLRQMGHCVGKNVYLPADLTITQNFIYNRGCLTIGDNVSIAPRVIIILDSHSNFSIVSKHLSNRGNQVIIDDGSWIGAGCILLNGVHIGAGSVVGCGSVVTHDVPPNTVVAGNPAKIIRTIDPNG